ncbi:FlgD immunoglobulin-like domain containing protein [Rosettibacter firmus]|uniref:FlgD immunoglobulin-like domain containing protein n=1 Tax=Rosettibacter firmus TaxID=3111522 RepID=UPI00336BFD96
MKLNKLFLMLTFLVLLGTTAFAQVTWYVNNFSGNDGRNGLSPTIPDPDDGVTGPKRTIAVAIAESNEGDIIVVANTGTDYGTVSGEPATIVVNKQLTFQSTGGNVNIASLLQINTSALAKKAIFNSGQFTLKGGLTLTQGTLDNPNGLVTVSGGTITVGAIATTTKVTGQLAFSGSVNWQYNANYTTGDEFPNTGGSINNLTTGAGVALTVKSGANITVNGTITTGGALNLGGNTWTVANASGTPTHTFGGDVTNGTLTFSMGGGNVALQPTNNTNVKLPHVIATTSTSTARTLDIKGQGTGVITIAGSLTVNQLASVTSSNNGVDVVGTSGYTGNALVLSGTGTVSLGTALTTIHGNVLLNTTNLSTNNAAQIDLSTVAAALTINGNVTNSAGIALSGAAVSNAGVIILPNQNLTINGNVTVNGSLSGSVATSPANTNFTNNGEIRFSNTTTTVTISGVVSNAATSTASGTTAGTTVQNNMRITFANTTGDVVASGGFSNSSSIGPVGATTGGNGVIVFTARTTGKIGTSTNRTGNVVNTSTSTEATNGVIDFRSASTGDFYGTNITQGSAGKGGDIIFGDHKIDITGNIVSNRTDTGADIVSNTVALTTVTITVGGYIQNTGKSDIVLNISDNDVVSVTGRVENTGTGQIQFTAGAASTGTITLGGLVVSSGTVSLTNHNAALTINGAVNISGGTVNLSSTAAQNLTITGNASFTGGTITTTNRNSILLNSASITIGGASSNPTFSGEPIVIGNPTPTQLVTVNIGSLNPVIAGNLQVNNTTGLAQAVKFTGGVLNINGTLSFTSGKVLISDVANLVVKGASFTNTGGYETTEQGRVTLAGSAAQTFGGAGNFGTIEFNNGSGISTTSPVTIKGNIYLTNGLVTHTGNLITIDNSTNYPTIVRNNGSFDVAPTFNSMVNVTYIGGDKSSGNEVPTAADKLNNLTVATTTGANGTNNVALKGVVTIGTATTVNGTITVNTDQTLLIDAVDLTMKGASIVLNGDIANEGAGKLVLAAATGTTITGSGYLPPIQIAANSTGNVINGPKALINQLVGADNERGGGDDFDPATTSANGNLSFGNGSAGLNLTLTGVAFDGTDLGSITTANANNSLVLGSDIQMSGNLNHVAGTIDLNGKTLTHLGTTPAITGGALTTNGDLVFGNGTSTGATTLTLNTSDVTIAANVNINLGAAGTAFTLAGGNNLIAAGNLTVTKGMLTLGQNLTVTGSNFTLTSNGSVAGAGVLRLNAANPPLTFSYTGTPSISNLRISNDVNLAGTGTGLTITTSFTHDGGVLNFGSRDLTFQSAFTRTAGSYTATTGYMIFDANAAWTIDQGDGFSIPNLRFTASTANNLTLSNAAGRGTVTVTNNLDMQLGAQTLTTNGKLAVADGATVNYTSGGLSAAPTYAGSIKLVALNVTSGNNIPANVWPSSPSTLVNTFVVNSAAAGNTVGLPGSRTVNQVLDLKRGTLALGANTLTLVSGTKIYRTENASVTKTTGGISFPADKNVTVVYQPTAASAGGDMVTGIELPSELSKLIITRSANVGNAVITVSTATTVNDSLLIRNDLTATAQVTAKGAVKIEKDNYTNATDPVVTFAATAPLVFGGASGQNLVLGGNQTIAYMKLDMPGTNPVLNVTGGNLTIPATGKLIFVNGILNMGNNTLVLGRPSAIPDGLGYDRTAVTGTNVGHVVGKVQRQANAGDGQTGTNGRFEFPVGTLDGQYRPLAITFTPSYPVGNPTSIVVSHVNSSPQGTVNLPLDGGNGVKVGNYAKFYWLISTTPTSLTATQNFDIELQANNIGYPYTSDAQLRIIRRQDGNAESNGWFLQGTAPNYSNYQVVSGTDTTVVVRTTSSQGGLVTQGSRFAIGVPTRAPVFTAPTAASFSVNEADSLEIQFTADPQDVGETVTYSLVSAPSFATLGANGLIKVKPGYADGRTQPYTITVRATDSGGQTADKTVSVTVVNVNRAPSFTASGAATRPTATVKNTEVFTFTYTAIDADGDALTYSIASVAPAPSGTYNISASTGTLTFTPAIADAGKVITFTIEAKDASNSTATTTTEVTVTHTLAKGDINGSGMPDATDASDILKHVVGSALITDPEKVYAADVNGDGEVGAYDAAWILYYVANGSWPTAKISAAMGTVEFDRASSEKGIISLPITLKKTSGVVSVYTEVQLTDAIEFKGVSTSLPEGWVAYSNFANGVLKIAMAGTTPLKDGNVAMINLALKDKEAQVNLSASAKLNDQSFGMMNVKVKEIPAEFSISQNYPNPFNPTTSIKYAIPQDARVTLVIYDMLGQVVKTLVDQEQEAGYYTVRWDGTNDFGSKVSSGIYIYRIIAGKYTSTMKMNLLK